MLWLGPTLLITALIMLALSIRGRLIARGRFCRRCKFDLQGLANPTACPECGRKVAAPRATRPTLRRPHRAALALAAALLLVGVTLTALSAPNIGPRILAVLPDRVVLALHAIHIDGALTEIATNRLARPKPLRDAVWRGLIDDALALQADDSRAWDPRHGEVLANALITGRLTDAQVDQYARHAITGGAEFPASIRHGTNTTGLRVNHTNSDRAEAINQVTSVTNGVEGLMIWLTISQAGVRSPDHAVDIDTWSGAMFTVPGPVGRTSGGNQFYLPLDKLDWSKVPPDSDLAMFVDYTISVKTQRSRVTLAEWTQTAEQPVRVLPADASLVRLNTDPGTIASFNADSHARLVPIYIPTPGNRTSAPDFVDLAHSEFIVSKSPVALSGHLYVIHNGRETRFGAINASAPHGFGMQSIAYRLAAPTEIDEGLLQSWLDAGAVTVELRPSPRVAEQSHDIREILGVTLRFEAVPVTDTQSARTAYGDTPSPDETTGRPIAP